MTIDEVIHECEHLSDEFDYENMNGNMAYSTYSDFKDSISKIQKWLEETRWIPVSERLPEKEDGDKYGTVLWCILYKEQHQLICDGHYQWKSKDGSQTHWMPLPLPPEQEV